MLNKDYMAILRVVFLFASYFRFPLGCMLQTKLARTGPVNFLLKRYLTELPRVTRFVQRMSVRKVKKIYHLQIYCVMT